MIGAAAESSVFKVAQAESDKSCLVEFQGIAFFGGIVEQRQFLVHADDFERALAQGMRFLCIQRENWIRERFFREDYSDDRLGAERLHRLQPMIAVGSPV